MNIIGVDPDAEAHGVAIYVDGVLKELCKLQAVALADTAKDYSAVVSIENVMQNQFVYARNRHGSKNAQSKIAMHIGRCQQAQVELMRILDVYEIPYFLHKPQKGNWADNKALFERLTGWTGRSNADTRAGAFFGYLQLQSMRPV